MTKQVIEQVRVDALMPYAGNARLHSKKQIRGLAKSITAIGFVGAILADEKGMIIAGHARLEAALLLGFERVPVLRVKNLSEAQKRTFILADNRIAEKATWDHRQLAVEFKTLITLDPAFELTVTGFEMGEIDATIAILDGGDEADSIDDLVAPDPAAAVSKPGDLWQLGVHRLICGDARSQTSYQALMTHELAGMVFTDPPYNVPIKGHVSGKGQHNHREFAMASGEMSDEEFLAFLAAVIALLTTFSKDGSVHFVCMDWKHIFPLLQAGHAHYDTLLNLCVWNKTNGGMGSLYRSKHELVAVFRNGKAAHINNVQLGRHGRNRTNVWDYAGLNAPVAGRDRALALHPTVKPVAMVADALRDCSNRGDTVLDPFCGSGTTLIAAERTGRVARCMEIDPLYVDAALRRWQKATGERAVHAETGALFDTLAREGRS
jgi:DNA modification methylase